MTALYWFCIACYALTLAGAAFILWEAVVCVRERFYGIAAVALLLAVVHGLVGAAGLTDSVAKLRRAQATAAQRGAA